MTASHDWPRIDATADAATVAAEVRASSRRHGTAAFDLGGPPLFESRALELATALTPLDGTYRFRAHVQPPLSVATVRALHRAGFVRLQLAPGSGYAAVLETVRGCDELGVGVRYSLATLREDAPKPFSLAVPALVHLTPPDMTLRDRDAKPLKKKGRLRRALAHWTTVHGTGLLSAQRGPGMLRIIDSRRTAWVGAKRARPRFVTLRDGDVEIFDRFREPCTLAQVAARTPDVDPEHFARLLTSLVQLSLLVPCGEHEGQPRLLSLPTFAPPWWERDALESRPPLPSVAPADSTVWQPFVRTQSWEHRPVRAPERRLPVVQEPS